MKKLNWKPNRHNSKIIKAFASHAVGGQYLIRPNGDGSFSVEHHTSRNCSTVGIAAEDCEARALAQANHDQRLAEVKVITSTPRPTSNRPTTREKLPNRRFSITKEFEFNGSSLRVPLHFTTTFSKYADGRLAELFMNAHKTGTLLDAMVRDAAVAASLALQFGCPTQTLRGALLRNEDNTPSSPLGAAFDLIAKDGGDSHA